MQNGGSLDVQGLVDDAVHFVIHKASVTLGGKTAVSNASSSSNDCSNFFKTINTLCELASKLIHPEVK